ncbi:MAG: MATE family efflux transporter [Eubacteriales bacterium]|nr:MATE family efflux transporter [Eubacteriales bacterium]
MKTNKENCLKEFIRYVTLNVLGMIGISCYILADTFFIAQGLGSDGLTALNLIIPVYNLMHGCGLMLGMGGASRYSMLKGQGKSEKGNIVFTHTVLTALVFAVFYMAAGGFFAEKISLLLGADEAVFGMCTTYLRTMLLFSPMFLLNDVFVCFVRNDGNPQLSMTAMLVSSLSNIVFDYIFIFIFGWGMFGAVFATGTSPVIGLCILSTHYFRKKNKFHFVKKGLEGKVLGYIFGGGLSSLIGEMSSGIVILVFNVIMLKLQGNTGVAAYGVIANLSLVMIAIYTGIGQGIQPLISRYYGMKQPDKIKKMFRYGLVTVGILSVLIYAGVFLQAEWIVGMFNSEADSLLQTIAEKGLKLYFTGGIFAGFNIVLAIYFMASDRIKPANLLSALRGFILIIPLAFLMAGIWKMTGLWMTFPVTELLAAAIGVFLFAKNRSRN